MAQTTQSGVKSRMIGLDFARGLAVFGMVIVNYHLVMGRGESDLASIPASLLSGRASALFVVLAGMGIALMTGVAGSHHAKPKQDKVRIVIRRALFLLIAGFLYTPLWPADILHFYGIYMLLGAAMLSCSPRSLLLASTGLLFLHVLLLLGLDYEQGWNFETLEYLDFWSPQGLIRHLFFNGFHPVIPWAAFLLTGIWLARQELNNPSIRKILLKRAAVILVLTYAANEGLKRLIQALGWNDGFDPVLFELGPMPPLPTYMLAAGSTAVIVIMLCINLCDGEKPSQSRWVGWIAEAGKLALTLYVAHVIIGMGIMEEMGLLGTLSNSQALAAALLFSGLGVVFAVLWRKRFKQGPLSWLMRRITDP